MSRDNTKSDEWLRSSLSSGGSPVEVRFISGGVQVRNAADPGVVITYTAAEWRDFLGGAVNGEFDGFGQTPTEAGG